MVYRTIGRYIKSLDGNFIFKLTKPGSNTFLILCNFNISNKILFYTIKFYSLLILTRFKICLKYFSPTFYQNFSLQDVLKIRVRVLHNARNTWNNTKIRFYWNFHVIRIFAVIVVDFLVNWVIVFFLPPNYRRKMWEVPFDRESCLHSEYGCNF